MFMFISGIISLVIIITFISILEDFENSVFECILGIIGIFSIYAIIAGIMDFMFWLGYIIGPYTIVVTILLILSPFIIWYLYDKFELNKKYKLTDKLTDKSNVDKSNIELKKCPKCGVALRKKAKKCPRCDYKF